MRLFDTGDFSNYWFETATPSFLINLLREKQVDIRNLSSLTVAPSAFSSYETEKLQILPLLTQTGYLTIQDYHPEEDAFTLGYPNREVKQSFTECLVESFTQIEGGLAGGHLKNLAAALRRNQLAAFFDSLRALFANVPYTIQLNDEKYYQTIFHLIVTMLGFDAEAETATGAGRIDAVIKTQDRIYLFEFKLHDTAESALEQIRTKRYFEKYLADGRPITLIGAAFDPQTRNLERWVTEGCPAVADNRSMLDARRSTRRRH
jgi:hypothetical protein